MVTSKENSRNTAQGTHPHLLETLRKTVISALIVCLICCCSSFLLRANDNNFVIHFSASQDIYKQWHCTFPSCSPDCSRLLESRNVPKKETWKFNWSSSSPFANEETEVSGARQLTQGSRTTGKHGCLYCGILSMQPCFSDLGDRLAGYAKINTHNLKKFF